MTKEIKTVLSVDYVCTDSTAMILSFPTGIYYTAQCCGVACFHPRFEGLIIALGDFMQDFNDCAYGCTHIPEMIQKRDELAITLDRKMKVRTRKWDYQIRFDFNRIGELMEGWWPVIVQGEIDHFNSFKGTFKGIIHTGNCD